MNEPRDIWFPAKRYGWGWGLPIKWQGWVVLLVYLAAVVIVAVRFPPTRELPMFVVLLLLATLVFSLVCWWKGEPPRWRWGTRDSRPR